MNVLFYTSYEVSPQQGGTERITTSVATTLTEMYGVRCYSMYSVELDKSFVRTKFEKAVRLPENVNKAQFIRDFITENDIDVIINQTAQGASKTFREAIRLSDRECKLVFVHHYCPGSELMGYTFGEEFRHFNSTAGVDKIKSGVKLLTFPLVKHRLRRLTRLSFHDAVDASDKVVLLSERFKDDFMAFANTCAGDKISAINNCLSFDTYFDMQEYDSKEKEVLIVSRLKNPQKKISLALRVWRLIEKDGRFGDWSLRIVGHGSDEGRYRRYVKQHGLKKVSFEGVQQPEAYYRRASIFMMTSAYEGWGLTLTEAQQFACVPMAFDSYKSLHDIIVDGETGCIVENKNCELYAARMKDLMLNRDLRRDMAANALQSCRRFERHAIAKQWFALLSSISRE